MNSTVQIAGGVATSLISLLTFAAVTRGLGPGPFGDLAASTAFLLIPLALGDIGLTTAVVRQIVEAPDDAERIVRTSIPFRTLLSAAVVAAAVGLAFALPFSDRARTAVLIGSVGAFLTLLTYTVVPVLQSELKMHWVALANFTGRVATFGFAVSFLALHLGFAAIVWSYVLGSAATLVICVFAASRLTRLTPILDTSVWRHLAVGSLWVGASLAISAIYFRLDTVLLALIRSSSEVGLYGAAWKFIELSQFAMNAVAVSVFPSFTRLVRSEPERFRALLQGTFDAMLAGAAPLTILLVVYAKPLIVLTSGPGFARAAPALQLLAPFPIFGLLGVLISASLIASHRERSLFVVALGVLLLNLALNLVFLPMYGYRAAAVTGDASEIAWLLGGICVFWHAHRFVPSLRAVRSVVPACTAMVAVAAVTPGAWYVGGPLSCLAYVAVVVVTPGVGRQLVSRLTAGLRPMRAASRL